MLKNIFSFAICKVFNNQCVIMWFLRDFYFRNVSKILRIILCFEMFRK